MKNMRCNICSVKMRFGEWFQNYLICFRCAKTKTGKQYVNGFTSGVVIGVFIVCGAMIAYGVLVAVLTW